MNHGCTLCGSSTISVSFSRCVSAEITRPASAQAVEVVHVGLVAVAVALGDDVAVDLVRQRAGLDVGALRAQAHGAAEVGARRCASGSCRRRPAIPRSARSPGAASRGRTRCCWRPSGRPRGARTRSSRPACPGRCRGRARCARARTARRRSCPRRRACRSRPAPGWRRSGRGCATFAAVSVSESTYSIFDPRVVVDAGVAQRLVERLVRVGQVDVLAAHRDRDLALRVLDLVHQLVPALQVGRAW